MKKLFIISDIHGHFDEAQRDLYSSGYDVDNEDHLLIVLGDNFDRGTQSVEIYNWLKDLTNMRKAIVLHGNHEDFMIDFLEGKDCTFNFNHNGFRYTIDSFLNQTAAWEMFCFYCSTDRDLAIEIYGPRVAPIVDDFDSVPLEVSFDVFQDYARSCILRDYPDLLGWLKGLPYYYETDNYIFTHAAIDGSCKDWHNPKGSRHDFWTPWQSLTWDDGSFYSKPVSNTNKTVVVGHFHTDAVRELNGLPVPTPPSEANSILRGDRKIFIDTCTVLTRRVNVLVLKDELM